VETSKKEPEENPVVYIELPESNGSDVAERRQLEEEESFVEVRRILSVLIVDYDFESRESEQYNGKKLGTTRKLLYLRNQRVKTLLL
jgi:hypothetical protein